MLDNVHIVSLVIGKKTIQYDNVHSISLLIEKSIEFLKSSLDALGM